MCPVSRRTAVGLGNCAPRLVPSHGHSASILGASGRLLACRVANVTDDDRVAAFVVAHLNIADCHAELDQAACAAEWLSGVHGRLLALLNSSTAPESLRLAASRQLHQTYAAMSEHRLRHGGHPLIEKALTEFPAHMPIPGALLH